MEPTNKEKTPNSESVDSKEKLILAEARIVALETENKKLREEIEVLRSRKTAQEGAAEFVEASGVLWKRKRSGGYESFPYCPTCKSTLSDYSGSLLCLKCNWQAPIKSFEAPKVYYDLFGEK
jgi:hypothetical protein